ncbi:MAG: GDP-mannose 4,6-dehydratase [Candidatus Margulisbacteria bacterium]|nr:GDP-mannose 4,6-dehydratase [Candidatus Margulisiibacteriota bacterium]
MPKVLITGAAGFIGSNLAKRLVLDRKTQVVGIDCFAPNYPREIKEMNVAALRRRPNFTLIEGNLLEADLEALAREGRFRYVFHQAATPGVRTSWGASFEDYVNNNILATQRLLEALIGIDTLKRFVYASSSSAYGDAGGQALAETAPCRPFSPYGVTKLSAEQICLAYFANFHIPVVALRYFSVYGPGQRPDMSFHQFIKVMLAGQPIRAHRDQVGRDFTFVGDVVQANLLARFAPAGEVFNVGGGKVVTIPQVIEILQRLIGQDQAEITWIDNPPGNVRHTSADLTKARNVLGYAPQTGIEQGLAAEIAYIRNLYPSNTANFVK